MSKKGFTLIELVVSMGILSVVLTMTVMIITQFMRIQELNTSMRATSQNNRQTVETITKEARQATSYSITTSTLNLTYKDTTTATTYCVSYALTANQITRSEKAVSGACTATDYINNPYAITSTNLTITPGSSGAIFSKPDPVNNLVNINFTSTFSGDSNTISETINVGSNS
jgi:prepilin-type N-terminal cleavage/methylation domain-containing protein